MDVRDTIETSAQDVAAIRTLVERVLDAWERKDAAAAAGCHALDGVTESPMFGTLHGRQAIEDGYRTFFTAFPDATNQVEAVIVEPPHAAVFTMTTATHANDFFGLPGTGRRIDFRNCHLLRIENGSITHVRRIYDFTGILLQVGVLRAKPGKG
jgi:steroid delta-isomerase-like uncharacterized protein